MKGAGFFLSRSVLCLGLLASACARGPIGLKFGNDDSARPQAPNEQQKNQTVIGFDNVNQLVFSKACLSCHGSQAQPRLVTFEDYKKNVNAVFSEVVTRKSMPKRGSLSDAEIGLVRQWVEQGALENGSAPIEVAKPEPTPSPEKPVTFVMLDKSFYAKKCSVCHFTENPEKHEDYSTFEKVRDNIGTILAATTIYATMPPPADENQTGEQNTNQLTRKEKELINRWILDGMKP